MPYSTTPDQDFLSIVLLVLSFVSVCVCARVFCFGAFCLAFCISCCWCLGYWPVGIIGRRCFLILPYYPHS